LARREDYYRRSATITRRALCPNFFARSPDRQAAIVRVERFARSCGPFRQIRKIATISQLVSATVRDRVVQMATLLILEPIFEADFLDCSYGFRPGANTGSLTAARLPHPAASPSSAGSIDCLRPVPHSVLLPAPPTTSGSAATPSRPPPVAVSTPAVESAESNRNSPSGPRHTRLDMPNGLSFPFAFGM
jgi:hypothetical protein